jgi:FAD/FMN-containing dehydrogenase
MIDALLSVRVVTADGSLLIASETFNPDLFWGIRGAGANLGIVTEPTYGLTPETSTYTSVDLVFPAGSNGTVLDWFADVDIPAKWAIGMSMGFSEEAGGRRALCECRLPWPSRGGASRSEPDTTQ